MFFMKPTAQVLRAQDLKDAERDLGAHLKATEYHGAMADMYAARVARLKAEIAAEKAAVDTPSHRVASAGDQAEMCTSRVARLKAEIAAEKAAVDTPSHRVTSAGDQV